MQKPRGRQSAHREPAPSSVARRKTPEELYDEHERQFLRRVGRRVAGLRVERDLSQVELAARAGINRSYLGFIEVGRRNPHLLSLRKIARALDVPVHDLLRIDER